MAIDDSTDSQKLDSNQEEANVPCECDKKDNPKKKWTVFALVMTAAVGIGIFSYVKKINNILGFIKKKTINLNKDNVVYLLDDYLNSLKNGKLNKQQKEFARGNFKVSPELIQRGEEIAREQESDAKDVEDIVKKE